MSSIYLSKEKVWRIAFRINGKRIVKSLRTRDARYAKELQKEYDVKIRRGELQIAQKSPIDSYLEEYIKDTAYRKKTTNQSDLYIVRHLLEKVGKKTVNAFTHEDVARFMEGRYGNLAPKTFNDALIAVRRFFRLAVQQKRIPQNPCDGIHYKKVPQTLPRFFTDEEYQRIEKEAEGLPIYPMIVTARYTGLRLGELLTLEWQDFDWERKLVRILNKEKFGFTVKNYQVRVIPISDELRDKLLPYIKKEGICFPTYRGKNAGSRYAVNGPKRMLKRVFKEAGIEKRKKIGWHDFRHTFASRLVQNNVPIYKVSKWLGHSSLEVTQIYAHFQPVYDEDIEKLSLAPDLESNSLPSSPTLK